MENLFFENQDVILSIGDYAVLGTTDKGPTVDVMVDCFLRNAYNHDKEGNPWYRCSKARDDHYYWKRIEEKVINMKYSDLQEQKERFYNYFRK